MNDLYTMEKSLVSLHRGRKFIFDVLYKKTGQAKPIIVFIHGFKGFKDWGHFNLMADYFAQHGFVFLKLNLSHNGTTPDRPTAFADLNAFGNNNFSIELDDVGTLINYLFSGECEIPAEEMDNKRLFLIGHSRGGGLAILKANEDERVKAVATLAAIHDLEKRWSKEVIEKWKQEGVQYIHNSRTGQDMPLYYQLVENFYQNRQRLDIPKAVKGLEQPLLIIHGTADETLLVSMAYKIKTLKPGSELMIVEGANHTFGGYHPYDQKELPEYSQTAFERIVDFFKDV